MMHDEYVENIIIPTLAKLYSTDALLLDHDLSERCIAFRFAHHLQNLIDNESELIGFYVDCDFNSSTYYNRETGQYERLHGKRIAEKTGDGETGRFIDIIVHRRTCNVGYNGLRSDLICFEIKKWNNQSTESNNKDRNNLVQLTSVYGYQFGFHLILGQSIDQVKLEIFSNGQSKQLLSSLK